MRRRRRPQKERSRKHTMTRCFAVACCALVSHLALAHDACPSRGDLSPLYCDEDRDLIADAPKDKAKWRNPASLMLSYSPQEDTAAYEKLWAPYVTHMSQCLGRSTRFLQVFSSAAAIEALRSGRIQFSLLATGDTPFAVNVGGAVPFAGIGDANTLLGYHVVVLVKHESNFKKLAELKGKRVAHTTPSSNSGNMAPRALFPAEGLTPDKDYKVIYSGKHDNSIMGVLNGDYDAAAVADDVLDRMLSRGLVKTGSFRVIYKSKSFPAGSMVHAHDLDETLSARLKSCTFSYAFSADLRTAFQGSDRFVPMNYQRDFESVRNVAQNSGAASLRPGFDGGNGKKRESGK